MGKTKYIIIAGCVYAAVMAGVLVLILKYDTGEVLTKRCICWVVLLLAYLWLLINIYRLYKDYNFWRSRCEEELSANADALMHKTKEVASLKSKIKKLSDEVDRLDRLNANNERTVSFLRKESGNAHDRLDECYKLLADLRERAEQGDKMKASFLANVTHELRTPLNSVLGYGAIINNPSVPEERRRHFMNVLQKSCDRFLDTLNDMLYYSQLQAGDISITTDTFEVSAMLCSLRDQTREKIAESGKNIKLVFTNDLTCKSYICGFEAGYYKILTNLLDNAVKFTNEGQITVGYESFDSTIRFEVSDTGIGFDSGKKELIFGSFNQSDASLSRQYEGAGLGLSICRSLVSQMNGTMDVESHPGDGSKFSFELPMLQTDNDAYDLYYKADKILEKFGVNDSIMVMSPYSEDFDCVNNFFGSYGIDVVRCRSLEEVEILVAAKPGLNIAIIDLSSSPDDGLAAASAISDINPKVRFAFVRGKELDKGAATRTGFYSSYVIQRPLSSKSLGSLLSTC